MHHRLVTSLALGLAIGLIAAGCSSRDDSETKSTSTSSRASTSTQPSDTTTTTAVPDLNAINVKVTKIATVERPTVLTVRKGDPTLYVVEKVGRIRAIRDGRLASAPVLDITSLVGSGSNEQGLLGLAFSPDGTKLYVNYTNRNGDTRVDELSIDAAGTVDRASRREVLAQDQPQSNHNGGNLAFGPDGMLYVGFGDGGSAGDQGPGHAEGGNGQSLQTWLGKLLRVDPTASGGQGYTIPAGNPFASTANARPEIWSYGLRNPWRFSFDKTTGDLWIGDVGQNAWEEVDFAAKASGGGSGTNWGWNVWEGTHRYRDGDAPGAVPPIFDFSHDGNCSVTGGYVYRGTKIPAMRGAYLFADYCGGQLRTLAESGGKLVQDRILPVRVPNITSFGQDNDGELYVLSDDGDVLAVEPA